MISYLKNKGDSVVFCDEKEAELVMIDLKEFNGLVNALRIVRERSLQQIDKAVADEHGYTVLRAEKGRFGKTSDLWKITKRTPYSVKMPLEAAMDIIRFDLIKYYKMVEPVELEGKMMAYDELFSFARSYEDGTHWEMMRKNRPTVAEFIEELDGVIVTEPVKLSSNLSQGVYEVTYYANKVV